jgi:hypothetical protein
MPLAEVDGRGASALPVLSWRCGWDCYAKQLRIILSRIIC